MTSSHLWECNRGGAGEFEAPDQRIVTEQLTDGARSGSESHKVRQFCTRQSGSVPIRPLSSTHLRVQHSIDTSHFCSGAIEWLRCAESRDVSVEELLLLWGSFLWGLPSCSLRGRLLSLAIFGIPDVNRCDPRQIDMVF